MVLTARLETQKKEAQQLQQRIQFLEKSNAQEATEHQIETQRLGKETAVLSARLEAQSKEVEQLKQRIHDLEMDKATLEKEHQVEKEKSERLQNEAALLSAQMAVLSKRVEGQKKETGRLGHISRLCLWCVKDGGGSVRVCVCAVVPTHSHGLLLLLLG